jgi:hypothetical protein
LTTKGIGSVTSIVVEGFRLQFPETLDSASNPTVFLAYWHAVLISDLFSREKRDQYALQDCKNIIDLITLHTTLKTPLNHHFVSLASLALLELAKIEGNSETATLLLRNIFDYAISPSPWNGVVRAKIADAAGRGIELDEHNLQRLANLATVAEIAKAASAIKGEAPASTKKDVNIFDPLSFLQKGYLLCFEEPSTEAI